MSRLSAFIFRRLHYHIFGSASGCYHSYFYLACSHAYHHSFLKTHLECQLNLLVENFIYLATDEFILIALAEPFFSVCVAALSMSLALILAGFADRVIRGTTTYRTLLIWPYAVAPVLAGALGFSCLTRLWYFHY